MSRVHYGSMCSYRRSLCFLLKFNAALCVWYVVRYRIEWPAKCWIFTLHVISSIQTDGMPTIQITAHAHLYTPAVWNLSKIVKSNHICHHHCYTARLVPTLNATIAITTTAQQMHSELWRDIVIFTLDQLNYCASISYRLVPPRLPRYVCIWFANILTFIVLRMSIEATNKRAFGKRH